MLCAHKKSLADPAAKSCGQCGECLHRGARNTLSGGRICDDCSTVLKRGETAVVSPDAIEAPGVGKI